MHNSLRTNAVRSRRGARRAEQRRGAVAVEAAFCLPLLVILMIGMWEVGRMVQVSQILANAAREGARYAAMGNLNVGGVNTPITVALVQQNIRDYLNVAGLPAAAYNGAQVQVTNLSGNTWTNPSDAKPMDKFQVTVTIPSGAAFSSLQWTTLSITGISQLSASATWVSLVDSQVSVNTQLPF